MDVRWSKGCDIPTSESSHVQPLTRKKQIYLLYTCIYSYKQDAYSYRRDPTQNSHIYTILNVCIKTRKRDIVSRHSFIIFHISYNV